MTDTLTPPVRRHDLDALRGFAMLLGIVLHGLLSFLPFPWPVQDSQQSPLLGVLFAAIHGFRMPLFFVVSGFFTAMLWRRRGLSSLLKHRASRILLPCVLGVITIVPATEWATAWAVSTAKHNETDPVVEDDGTLVAAIRIGDIDAFSERLLEADDLDRGDPWMSVPPLGWAALVGNTEMVEMLLARGADPNATTSDGASPLLLAAFMGYPDVCEILLEHGGDPRLLNQRGESPFEATEADWGTTRFVADLLKLTLREQSEVAAGRKEVTQLLEQVQSETANPTGDSAADEAEVRAKSTNLLRAYQGFMNSGALSVTMFGKSIHLVNTPIFHHLWFLWFLCLLVPSFALATPLLNLVARSRACSWLVVSWARFLWLVPLTLVPQWFMGIVVPTFGPDTSIGLLPQPHILLYYAIFFGYGALYYDADDSEGRLGRYWWLLLPSALLIVFPIGLAGMSVRPVTAIAQVIFVWAMTFGLIGVFRRFASSENTKIRYLSDSSYWLYLAHLPLIIVAQAVVRDWSLPMPVKFTLLCSVVVVVLLASYHWGVRYTWIGWLLNGPRKKPVASRDPQFA